MMDNETAETELDGELLELLGRLPAPETEWHCHVVGVEQKDNESQWRVKLYIEAAPGQNTQVIRLSVPVDRARAWGAQVGRRVKLRLSLEMEIG